MALNVNDLFKTMMQSAAVAFGAQWNTAKAFVPGELRKLAVQIADIAENVAKFQVDTNEGFPPATGQVLLRMQRRSLEATLTAVTALTLIAVQDAVNKILKALKDAFGDVLDFVL